MNSDSTPEPIPDVIPVDYAEPLLVVPVTEPGERRPALSRTGSILAWVVIVGLVVFIAGGFRTQRIFSRITSRPPTSSTADANSTEQEDPSSEPSRLGTVIMEMQGRYLVGAGSIVGNAPQLYDQAEQLNSGPMPQRIRFAILAGELSSPQEAVKRLSELDRQNDEEAKVRLLLKRLYEDYSKGAHGAPELTEAEGEQLERYGWFGELALHPAGSEDAGAREAIIGEARKTFVTVVGAVTLLGIFCLFGLFGLMALLAFTVGGSVRSKVRLKGKHSGVYAETFALYLLLFIGLSAVVGRFGGDILLMGSIATLLSLLALAWPVVRGVTWQQVREDIGLTKGRGLLVEPVLGVAGYAMTLPILAVGVLLVFLLMLGQGALKGLGTRPEASSAQGNGDEHASSGVSGRASESHPNPMLPDDFPAHPIVLMDTRGWWNKFLLLFLACIAAPLVEETMFRGVLHRHLRGATAWLGSFLSIVVSGSIASFIFAAIHPQGWIAIPALMALAYGFTILREWRGSVIPGMIAHGLNNGIVLTAFMLIMGN